MAGSLFRESALAASFSLSGAHTRRSANAPAAATTGKCERPWVASSKWCERFRSPPPNSRTQNLFFYPIGVMSAPPERLKLAPGVQVMLSAMLPRHTWDCHTLMPDKKNAGEARGWMAASPADRSDLRLVYSGDGQRERTGLALAELSVVLLGEAFLGCALLAAVREPRGEREIGRLFEKLALHWLPYYMVSRASWDPSAVGGCRCWRTCAPPCYGDARGTMVAAFSCWKRSMTESLSCKTWRLTDPRAIYRLAPAGDRAALRRACSIRSAILPGACRVRDVKTTWDAGWTALENLKPPTKDVEMFNPAVGK